MNRVVTQKNGKNQTEIANVSVLITHSSSLKIDMELYKEGYCAQIFGKNESRRYTEK